jgi:nitroimidazol reductase NimA-like FMN-containing flavoprotein (pyridoxamine 5'-phosphate oxidase superfamily)
VRHPETALEKSETLIALLERSPVGRMAIVDRKGFPVIKPVNFLYWNKRIYIHSSKKGEKIESIRRGRSVCFEVDEPIAYAATQGSACKASYYYRSVIIKGKASLVNQKEKKLKILERLMEKYQPEGGYGEIQGEVLKKTAIIEISVHEMTGKENLG